METAIRTARTAIRFRPLRNSPPRDPGDEPFLSRLIHVAKRREDDEDSREIEREEAEEYSLIPSSPTRRC